MGIEQELIEEAAERERQTMRDNKDARIASLEAENERLRAILTSALDTGLTSANYDAHECIETTKAARAALEGRG